MKELIMKELIMKELTELEVCERIADIEKEYSKYEDHYVDRNGNLCFGDGANWYEYNPLTDNAMCFNLMIKYKVDICRGKDEYRATLYLDNRTGPYIACSKESLNKAICLAIIEAHKE